MNILVIPTTDWIRHPVPSRHHFIFERLGKKHSVYVWHFNIFQKRPITRAPKNIQLIKPVTIPVDDPAGFYAVNAPLHSLYMLKVVKEYNIDVVFNAQLLHGLSSSAISKTEGLTSVFDLSDYFPQSASVYYTGKANALKRYAIETLVLRLTQLNLYFSDLCIAPTTPLVNLVRVMTRGKMNAHLITNGVDTEHFKPLEHERKLADLHCIKNNAIGFVGSVEPWLDLETVLRGMTVLRKEIPDVQLVLIGSGIRTHYYEHIKRLVQDYDLQKNFVEIGTIPYERIPMYLSLLKGCIIPFRTDLFLSKIALPNKFFEYCACAKPIISTQLPEVKRIAGNLALFYSTSQEFYEQTKRALTDENLEIEISSRSAALAKQYDWNIVARKLEMLIQKC